MVVEVIRWCPEILVRDERLWRSEGLLIHYWWLDGVGIRLVLVLECCWDWTVVEFKNDGGGIRLLRCSDGGSPTTRKL